MKRSEGRKLSVVIVSYNVKHLLEQCLLSLRRALAGMEAEVWVTDNASTDGSVAELRAKFPEVAFIANEVNRGFAAANNQALQKCGGEYVLFLNPDTVVGEDCLRTLCYFMDEHPQAGGVGVKMLDGHGRFLPESKRSVPTPWVAFCKLIGLARLFPMSPRFARYSLLYLNPDQTHRVDILSGAFMLVRREALRKTGGFDEAFFMYGEDIDLSERLTAAGYVNYYLPERLLHYKGESTRREQATFVKRFYGAMGIYYKKHYPRSGWWAAIVIRLAIDIRTLVAAIGRKHKHKQQRNSPARRRLLVLCRQDNFPVIKDLALRRLPDTEYIRLWNLDAERPMDALARSVQRQAFTDIAFCAPDMRFEQMLLFMDTAPDKRIRYHIYNKESGQLVSPKQL